MNKITTITGAVVAAIIVLQTTYGLALTSTVNQVVTEQAPMRGLFLKVSKDLQAERLKLARSRAKLLQFPKRKKQWESKLTSIQAETSSISEQVAAGIELIETGEQSFEIDSNRYTRQEIELDLTAKADRLRSLRERRNSTSAALSAIEVQEANAKTIISQSETAILQLETRLAGLSTENENLSLLRDLNVLLPDSNHLLDSSPILENMNEIDARLDVLREILDGHRSQPGGVNYVKPSESELDIESIKESLLN